MYLKLTESSLPSQDKKEDESEFMQCTTYRENTPLLTEADGSTSQAAQQAKESTIAAEHESDIITVILGPPHSRIEADSSTIVYAEVNLTKPGNIPIPAATEEVTYQEIKEIKSEQVCITV